MWFLLFLFFLVCLALIIIYSIQNKIIFPADQTSIGYKYSKGEEIILNVDGGTIHSLVFEVPTPKGTIIYFHGNGGSLRDWIWVHKEFNKYGWNVLITDYRGYGKSRLEIVESKLYSDALEWYSYVKERFSSKIIVYGRSIGTGIAVNLASHAHVEHLILESPFTSIKDIIGDLFCQIPDWLVKYHLPSIDCIDLIDSRITIIHGTNDELIDHKHALKLKAKNPRVNLVSISNGHHNDLSDFEEYHSAIKRILDNE